MAGDAKHRLPLTFQVKSWTHSKKRGGYRRKLKARDATITLPLSGATGWVYKKKKKVRSLMQLMLRSVVKGGGCMQSGRERTIAVVAPARSSLRCLMPRKKKALIEHFEEQGGSRHPETPPPLPTRVKHEVWSSQCAGMAVLPRTPRFVTLQLRLLLCRLCVLGYRVQPIPLGATGCLF